MKLFETHALSLASYLTYLGHELHDVHMPEGSRTAMFEFVRSRDLDADVVTFTGKEAQVEPHGYAQAYRQMKRRLYQTVDQARAA